MALCWSVGTCRTTLIVHGIVLACRYLQDEEDPQDALTFFLWVLARRQQALDNAREAVPVQPVNIT